MLGQKTLAHYLDDLESPLGKILNGFMAMLVVLSSVIFVAQTYGIPAAWQKILLYLDQGILVAFCLEYGLRLWCAENRWRYVLSAYSIIDLLAILPFFLGVVDIRYIRLLRWFRILRLIRLFHGKTLVGYISSEDELIVTRILFTLFSILFVYSGLIYQVEHINNSQVFKTFFDAFYFSVVTMTTVGFGDLTPTSELGRLLTVMMIMTGIALIPWQVGDLIKRLVKSTTQVEVPCRACGKTFHDTDAYYCKMCGTRLTRHQ